MRLALQIYDHRASACYIENEQDGETLMLNVPPEAAGIEKIEIQGYPNTLGFRQIVVIWRLEDFGTD